MAPPKAQAFTDMQKNMESELEQRRLDWEREIGDMQKDFFNMGTEPKGNDNGVSSEGPVKVGVDFLNVSQLLYRQLLLSSSLSSSSSYYHHHHSQ